MKHFTDADRTAGFLPPLNLGYVRYSTDSQEFEVQRETVERAIVSNRFENFQILEEPVVSRTVPFFEREIGALILRQVEEASAQGREINLVFPKVDRFGAGVVDITVSAQRLQALGAKLIFLDLNIDTRTIMGEAMLQISAVLSGVEVKRIRERTKETMATKRRASELTGSLTYGWNAIYNFRDGHTQIVCDRPLNQTERAVAEKLHGPLLSQTTVDNLDEQRWLRHMDAMERGGASFAAIARDLNTKGVPTKMGRQLLKLRCSAGTVGALKAVRGKGSKGTGFYIEKMSKGRWQVGNVEGVLTNETVRAWLTVGRDSVEP